ncbi:cadherin-22-like [Heptranchias perlo]|uniref:cadherin-22-like n=1 Tax=Heptranchias perlo TaxID=212740 RepID=UPI003559CD0F
MVNRTSLWLTSVALCVLSHCGTNSTQESLQRQKWNTDQSKASLVDHRRVKRGWVWNQFFIVEEYTGTEPLYVGKIHSDSDKGDGSIKYTISGEGAGTVFIIDEITGDIHATERLDREEKTYYTLRAQARDRLTDRPLEPESEFIIKVQDINDSEPKFLDGPYIGSVPELSPVECCVQFWLPYYRKDIIGLKKVQRATYLILGIRLPSYKEALQKRSLFTREKKTERDLMEVFEILKVIDKLNPEGKEG